MKLTAQQLRDLAGRSMTEAEFLRMVLQLAKVHGWRSFHARPARTAKGWRTAVQGDGKGFPDVLLLRGNALIAAELKVGRNKATPEQMEWLLAFRRVYGQVRDYIWRPTDWPEIESILGEKP
jgi:hypothetical protein